MISKQPTKRQQHWLSHIQACDKTELSYRAYAEQQGFTPRALYDAKKQRVNSGLLPSRVKSRFQRVRTEPSKSLPPVSAIPHGSALSPAHCTITLPNGISLEWPVACPSASLAAILAAVATS